MLPFLRSRSSRSSRRSTTPRSARMTSSSIARTSRAGSTEPAGCGTAGSRNIRTTCSSASALRNGATSRSACAPVRAPPTPAMSANSTVAGTCLRGLKIAVSLSSRSSGTRDDADVRVRLAGLARARRLARARQQLEERGLARRGESDEACAKHRNALDPETAGGPDFGRCPARAGPIVPCARSRSPANLHIVARGGNSAADLRRVSSPGETKA